MFRGSLLTHAAMQFKPLVRKSESFAVWVDQRLGARWIDRANWIIPGKSINRGPIHYSSWVANDPASEPRRVVTRSVIAKAGFSISFFSSETVPFASEAAETRFAIGRVFLAIDRLASPVDD